MDCPTCGAPAHHGQLVCLECGSRIALSYRRPPSWKLPAAIVAAVGVLTVAGALIAYEAIDDEAQREVAATPLDPQPVREKREDARRPKEGTGKESHKRNAGAGAPRKDGRKPESRRDRPAKKNTPAPAADGLVRKGALYSWPKTLRGFTVVVLSAEDRASATRFARRAAAAKTAKIGVIRSDDFDTLPKGFYVVFAGRYDSRARADKAAARLGRRYPGAFPQRVAR